MKTVPIPAEKYIRRDQEMITMTFRIPKHLKEEMQRKVREMGTSISKFLEASTRYYLDNLENKN